MYIPGTWNNIDIAYMYIPGTWNNRFFWSVKYCNSSYHQILYSEQYTHLNIRETCREIYHLKDTIKQEDVFMVFSKRTLKSLDVFRHSLEKPYNTCTT